MNIIPKNTRIFRGIHFLFFFSLFLLISAIASRSQMQQQAILNRLPVKLSLATDHKINAGRSAIVAVTLLDIANDPAVTESDVTVTVNVKWPSGKVLDFPVTIKGGSQSATLPVTMPKPGICRIRATQDHLLSAS